MSIIKPPLPKTKLQTSLPQLEWLRPRRITSPRIMILMWFLVLMMRWRNLELVLSLEPVSLSR